ncbi:hypothetical protein [Glaciimonas soli]|nr:hypothetical protein [Glaciimonas soli]
MFDIDGPYRKTEPSRFERWVEFLALIGIAINAIVTLFSLFE